MTEFSTCNIIDFFKSLLYSHEIKKKKDIKSTPSLLLNFTIHNNRILWYYNSIEKKKTKAENFSNTIYHKNKKLSILLEDLFEEEIVSIKTKSKL